MLIKSSGDDFIATVFCVSCAMAVVHEETISTSLVSPYKFWLKESCGDIMMADDGSLTFNVVC